MRRRQRCRDSTNGGYGRRNKFPQSPLLLAHLRHIQRIDDPGTRDCPGCGRGFTSPELKECPDCETELPAAGK